MSVLGFARARFLSALVVAAIGGSSVLTQPARADLQRFVEVAPGVFRGDQPDTETDYRELKRHGIRTILNLRDDGTVEAERRIADRMGFEFENVPMSGFLYPSEKSVEQALRLVNTPSALPVYVHCRYGKDRTGLIMALYRVLYQRWPRKAAYDEWLRMGYNPILVNLSGYFYLHAPDRD